MSEHTYHSFHLSFTNPDLEERYIIQNDENHVQFYRVGLILSYAAWFCGLIWSYIIMPQYIIQWMIIVLGIIFPLFTIVLKATYSSPLPSYFQRLVAIANLVAGLACLYIGIYLFRDYSVLSITIALMIGFAHFILKLRFKIAMVITIVYTLLGQIIVFIEGDYTLVDLFSMSLGFWVALIAFGLGGFYHEKILRTSFLQNLQIEEQRKRIIEEQQKSKELLLNILPEEVAKELMDTGHSKPAKFDEVSILFSDFKGFTNIVATIPNQKTNSRIE